MKKAVLTFFLFMSVSSFANYSEQEQKNSFPKSVSEVESLMNQSFLSQFDLTSCLQVFSGLLDLEVLMNQSPSEHFAKIKAGCIKSSNNEPK